MDKKVQNMIIFSSKFKKNRDYWSERLLKEFEVPKFYGDNYNYSNKEFKINTLRYKFSDEIAQKIIDISNNSEYGIYVVLLSCVSCLLSKYSGCDDISIAVPLMKNSGDLGVCNSALPIILNIKDNFTLRQLLNYVAQTVKETYSFGKFPLDRIRQLLHNDESKNINYLLDTMVVLKNIHDTEIIKNIKSNIGFYFELKEKNIELEINYNSCLYEECQINQIEKHLIYYIENIVKNPNYKISEIDILSKQEKQEIVEKFNSTNVEYKKDITIQELFELQVEKTPDNIAVIFEDKKLTYRELNAKSNSLARVLRNKGVKADSIVAIMVDRSLEMIIGMLGILKAGGAYLPIDPSYPKQRIEYMLNDSGSQVLLTEEALINGIEFKGQIIDSLQLSLLDSDDENLEKINNEDNLAYVIYTSGTTGNPKGVMLKHSNLNNFIMSFNKSFNSPIGCMDKVLSLTNYVFDVSVCEIFVALTNGSTLVMNNKHKTFNPAEISNLIVENEITFTYIPPLLLINVYEELKKSKAEVKLNKLLVGVEAIRGKTLSNFYDLNKDIEIINGYGPTETTICSTFYKVNGNEIDDKAVSIGNPIGNTKIYILNNNKLQSIGVLGELCISGDGLAKGYLNKPQLTAEKFVDNPFDQGTKMYKTGDLARWLPDGNIEFLGRIDNQVKIRGFRIELGEIESRILQHEDVKEATVIVIDDKDNDKSICSYIVSDKELNELNLRDYLKESLPEYMIPSYFVKLERMPITSNGKLDRRALPKPNLDERLTSYEAPRIALEETLVRVWSEILGIQKIGINDNFFELGGHSLKAMTLISKIHKETNKEVPLKELFKSPTIKGLSKFIEEAEESIYSKIEKVEEREYYEASSAQKRMYIIQGFDKESMAYNMPQVFEIQGSMDKVKIEDTFKKLVQRHEALRTYFEVIDGEIIQKIDKSYEFKLDQEVLNQSIEEIANDFVKPFDLGKAPLFRAEIVEAQSKNYLLIDMHHIISDGVSMSILISEFTRLYNGKKLEPLSIQYKDFSTWQNNLLKTQALVTQEEYWTNIFEGDIPLLELPYDYERPSIRSLDGDSVELEIDRIVTSKLKELSRKTETTMHMVILSAFNILLYKYSGQEDVVIGIPIAGRRHSDIQNVIGVFVNTLAQRNKPKGDKRYIDFLKEVKENSLRAYDNQDYQIETLIQKLNIVREQGRNPLFDVIFNTLNIESEIIGLDEIILKPILNENKTVKFDLNLSLVEGIDNLQLNFVYCKDLFNRESIEIMRDDFIDILNKISEDENLLLQDILVNEENCKKNIQMDDEFCF